MMTVRLQEIPVQRCLRSRARRRRSRLLQGGIVCLS